MVKYSVEGHHKELLDYIIRMAYIAEIKEWDNRPHLERIRKYSYILATGIGLPQTEIELISVASQLHDIGKINIPEAIAKRTDNLEPFEWSIIESHTFLGAKLLKGSSSPILQAGEIIAYTHHERWDGSGYPQGLKGDENPISGRICALADVYDALTTKRSYKEEIPDKEALKLITQSSGKLFDPQLVEVLKNNFEEILKSKTP